MKIIIIIISLHSLTGEKINYKSNVRGNYVFIYNIIFIMGKKNLNVPNVNY